MRGRRSKACDKLLRRLQAADVLFAALLRQLAAAAELQQTDAAEFG